MRRWGAVAHVAVLVPVVAAATPSATLDRTTLPARGQQQARLTVTEFGRYAITARSRQGTALQLVDRMAGPGDVAGAAGEADGRLDPFLDQGTYLLRTLAHERGEGDVTLEVHPFAELHAPQPPRLVDLRLVTESLRDMQQASWWVEVPPRPGRKQVLVEAAGRSLSDLRLWRNGDWLVDATPQLEVVQPTAGQPLLACRISVTLDPGLYLLTAYGGPSQPWSVPSDEHPLLVRTGMPRVPEAARRHLTMSPFGIDRFLVPGGANLFRIELPEARPAQLRVGPHDSAQPFAEPGALAEVDKDSMPPVAELEVSPDRQRLHAVVIRAEAGQPYTLQHFDWRPSYEFEATGDYWISTVHTGNPKDSIDATAIDTVYPTKAPRHETPHGASCIPLDSASPWARRFNLTSTATVHFEVREPGNYDVLIRELDARARLEPFFTLRPPDYETPRTKRGDSTWDLDAGYHVLTLEPEDIGIVTVAVRRSGLFDGILDLVRDDPTAAPMLPRASVHFPVVRQEVGKTYVLRTNLQPDVKTGIVQRKLPLDLEGALPLTLNPGEEIQLRARFSADGTLRAEVGTGPAPELAVDGGPWAAAHDVTPGEHDVAVRLAGDGISVFSLVAVPELQRADTPLPPLDPDALAKLPVLRAITATTPQWCELERGGDATFVVRAERPGLYRLETTGLLATAGTLRTRVVPAMFAAEGGGAGRNALLQQYLRQGDYQVTVRAVGRSAGLAGLRLRSNPVDEAGTLEEGLPARVTIEAAHAVAYAFRVTEDGQYRLRVLGLGHSPSWRLEDGDGWPLVRPPLQGELLRELEPGAYRIVVLPQAGTARAVTVLERVLPPRKLEGHGPHELPLDVAVEHVWMEPGKGGERTPDTWELTMPADAGVRVELSAGMEGELVRLDASEPPRPIRASKPYAGPLERGRHALRVRAARRNNQLRYTVAVRPDALVAGLSRSVTAPARLDVAVGEDSQVQLRSLGSEDTRARLIDAGGRVIARSDDAPDDWNFDVTRRLAPGRYRLQVDPVGAETATTVVSMRAVPERVLDAQALPLDMELTLGVGTTAIPIRTETLSPLLVVSTRSSDAIGLAVDRTDGDAHDELTTTSGRSPHVEVAGPERQGRTTRRLRLWSLGGASGAPIRVQAVAVAAEGDLTHLDLEEGLVLEPVAGIDPPVGVAFLTLLERGLFRIQGDARGVRYVRDGVVAALAADDGLLDSPQWVVADLTAKDVTRRVAARRIALGSGPDDVLHLVTSDAPTYVNLEATGSSRVVIASSTAGQPAVAVLDDGRLGRAHELHVASISPGEAVAVTLDASPALAAVARGEPGRPSLPVRVTHVAFEAPRADDVLDGALEPRTSREVALPGGAKRVTLHLEPGVVAALADGRRVVSAHGSPTRATSETLDTRADTLTLFNVSGSVAHHRIEAASIPSDEVLPDLTRDAPLELHLLSAGVLRVPVRVDEARGAPSPLTLHVRGASGPPRLVDRATSRVGVDVPVEGEPSHLLVPHDAGLVLAWIDAADDPGLGVWGEDLKASADTIEPPAIVPLGGANARFRLKPSGPVLLHARCATPLKSRLVRGDEAPEIDVHPRGLVLDAYLPDGQADLWLRPLEAGALSGTLEVSTSPLGTIGEGLGPELLLGPGDARAFTFTTPRAADVGVGVRSSTDRVEAVLLDGVGRTLGRGVVLMPHLEPGTHVLVLRNPPDAAVARARPAVVGLTEPGTGPPEDVIRRYLAPESDAAAVSATVPPPPDDEPTWDDVPHAEGHEEEGDGS